VSNHEEYRIWIALAQRIAAETGTPRFYIEQARPVGLSGELFTTEPLVAAGLKLVKETAGFPGHGVTHITKVAVDTGALILIAAGGTSPGSGTRRQVLLAHLAGILHDIRREERDHAQLGAQEAQRLLNRLSLPEDECLQIAAAIRNHEAFRPRQAVPGLAAGLLSDALYDADKFRWGPDNFTDTLWAMAASRGIPLARLVPRFLQGLDGIEKIRGSFRTPAGQQYGPDFIDRGLAIGRRLHAALSADGEGGPSNPG
jgi:hypothetical protein